MAKVGRTLLDRTRIVLIGRRTGDEKWLERARRFAAHSIDQCEAAAQQFGQYRYSLWTGDIGFAIFLWGCINGDDRIPTQDIF